MLRELQALLHALPAAPAALGAAGLEPAPRSLPADLVACVLAHLPLPFKLRAAAVCSEWRAGAGTPHLYAVLDRAQLARLLV